MAAPPRGRADFYSHDSWNAVCYECGRKRKASYLVRNWQGYYVCPEHNEPRQPQDFVRGVQDIQTPPWTQPNNDTYVTGLCTLQGRSGVAGLAVAGCSVAGLIPSGLYEATQNPPQG